MAEEIERIYVIPLKKTGFNSAKAAPTAIKRVKIYLTRHMKVEEKNIWIDDSLNNALWSRGKYSMQTKIRVKAVKFDDGVVEAYLPELEFKKSRRELLKEEREKKEPILKKEEIEREEAEGETGAEDYEISPTADGEVKIKKKKATKEKEEKKKEKKPAKKEEKKTKEKPKKAPAKKEAKGSSKKTVSKKKKSE
jgi:large subunit ribosomal protein L31e